MNAFSIIPLQIEAKGEIITNNLPEFRELVREALGNINRDLVTDEQFGQAELDVKALKEAEDAVRTAAVKAFDDQLKALVDGLNETAEEIRVPRLELEKIIAKRKEDVKSEIVEEFLGKFDIDPNTARKHFLVGLQSNIKGKRTLESMRAACRIYQTTQQAMIVKCREILARFEKAHGQDLIPDQRELELEKPEGLEAELRRRFEAKRAREEAAKLKAEVEAAKAALQKIADEDYRGNRSAESQAAHTALAEMEAATNPAMPEASPESPPWAESPLTEESEWKAFKSAALAAFAPLKSAKASLQFPKNSAKAQIFANAINAAWQEVMQ